jgi:hypothetical protein
MQAKPIDGPLETVEFIHDTVFDIIRWSDSDYVLKENIINLWYPVKSLVHYAQHQLFHEPKQKFDRISTGWVRLEIKLIRTFNIK